MISAFAPASVANVAVGFDHLGYAMDAIGDVVTVRLTEAEKTSIQINKISDSGLPTDESKNTASLAVSRLLQDVEGSFLAELWVEKGVPISSGLGGSASSAVAAVFATSRILETLGTKLPEEHLKEAMVTGEAAASGARHYDNVLPSYKGGLQLINGDETIRLSDTGWYSVCVHPDIKIPTKEARGLLPGEIALELATRQTALSMATLFAIEKKDFNLLRKSMKDLLVEPFRCSLIPGFSELQQAATHLGAAGFSISGAGPTVFCWCESQKTGEAVADEFVRIFKTHSIAADKWVTPIERPGVRILNEVSQYAQ